MSHSRDTRSPPLPDEPRDGTVTLSDGRRLGFARYGRDEGIPILYCHGFPGSRREAGLIEVDPTVSVIAVDRPGYGLSDPLPVRTLQQWSRDVAELADALEIERFGVVGMSGGAPYAAAVAHDLGPARVRALALISGVAPPDEPWHAGGSASLLFTLGRNPVLAQVTAAAARGLITKTDAEAAIAGLSHLLNLGSRRMPQLAAAERLVAGWRTGLRHGIAGPLSDIEIYTRPWGFRLEDIHVPTSVWHGVDDRQVPIAAGHLFARRIPNATAVFLEREGHHSFVFRRHRDILESVLRHA